MEDFDNDGRLDLAVTTFNPVEHMAYYRNSGNGTFEERTESAGLTQQLGGKNLVQTDYNNDGNTDLLVTYYGQNLLYRNEGDGTFTDITRAAGLISPEDRYSTGAAFLDYDRDGKLDLFVVGYTAFDEAHSHDSEQEKSCRWKGLKVFCGPRGLRGARCFLYRNNGNGTFTDVSEQAGIHRPGLVYGFTPLVLDYDNDGWPDIYVACDSSQSLLFHNNRNGTFTEMGVMAGVAYNEDGR